MRPGWGFLKAETLRMSRPKLHPQFCQRRRPRGAPQAQPNSRGSKTQSKAAPMRGMSTDFRRPDDGVSQESRAEVAADNVHVGANLEEKGQAEPEVKVFQATPEQK